MFTIFHPLELLGYLAGLIVGWWSGFLFLGWPGGIIGALVECLAGGIAGRMPGWLTDRLIQWSLRRASVTKLRGQLESEYFTSHLIIAELIRRGEPRESFRKTAEAQHQSPSDHVKRFGELNARLWFPKLIGSR